VLFGFGFGFGFGYLDVLVAGSGFDHLFKYCDTRCRSNFGAATRESGFGTSTNYLNYCFKIKEF